MGLDRYLDAQLHPDRLPDDELERRLEGFDTLDMDAADISQQFARPFFAARRGRQARQTDEPDEKTPKPTRAAEAATAEARQAANRPLQELRAAKVLRAAYSTHQLEEVLTDFWFNHFNVDARKGVTRFMLTEYEREAIRPHVFARFRDLLGATATSPAMLFYLDNWMSADPDASRTVERVSRRGRFRPMAGPAPAGAGHKRGLNENYARELMELHTLGVDGGYTQQDITEVARAFAGWTLDRPRQGGGRFRFDPSLHARGDKVVLGQRISEGGIRDGEQVLDFLARHSSTARFIATKLARRFVSDNPPPTLVDRAAARFRATDGDLREVVRTILTAPEFLAREAMTAKTKTPFEFVISAIRAVGIDVRDARPVARQIDELGMPLYQCQPPTGYKDTADAWTNTGALLARMNVAQQIAQMASASSDVPLTLETQVVGELSTSTRAVVDKAASDAQRVALILGSPEFQKK